VLVSVDIYFCSLFYYFPHHNNFTGQLCIYPVQDGKQAAAKTLWQSAPVTGSNKATHSTFVDTRVSALQAGKPMQSIVKSCHT